MFEPENDMERMLVRAATSPAERPGFARALTDAQVYIVLVPEGGPIPPGPDGRTVIPEGTKMTFPSAAVGEQRLVPFFTSPSRAREWYKGDHVVLPEQARKLFAGYPGRSFFLNPGSDYRVSFTPDQVQQMLAGQVGGEAKTEVIREPEQVLLAHPKEIPADLIAALGRELGAVKSVSGAWLKLAVREGHHEQSWMLGVEHGGSWKDVQAAIGRAVAGNVLKGRMLDAVPLDSSSLSGSLRGGIPVLAASS